MRKIFHLTDETAAVLAEAAKYFSGREVCAFLLAGEAGSQDIIVARNWSADPHSFSVSASEWRRIQRYAETRKQELAAFIHTHRGSLELSGEDRKWLAASRWPWIVAVLWQDRLEYNVYSQDGGLIHSGKHLLV